MFSLFSRYIHIHNKLTFFFFWVKGYFFFQFLFLGGNHVCHVTRKCVPLLVLAQVSYMGRGKKIVEFLKLTCSMMMFLLCIVDCLAD